MVISIKSQTYTCVQGAGNVRMKSYSGYIVKGILNVIPNEALLPLKFITLGFAMSRKLGLR